MEDVQQGIKGKKTMLEFLKMMFKLLNQNSGALLVVFSLVVTLATVFYVILTRSLVSETRKMREAQTEPDIFISIQLREESINLVDMIIRNIGLGSAYSLKFEVNADFEYRKGHKLSQLNLIKNGLNYLAPNQRINIFTSYFPDLIKRKIITPFNIKVTYKNKFERPYENEYTIDFSEFIGLIQVSEPSLKKVANNLEKIQRDIHTIIYSSYPRIKVVTHTKKDMEEEKKRQLEQID